MEQTWAELYLNELIGAIKNSGMLFKVDKRSLVFDSIKVKTNKSTSSAFCRILDSETKEIAYRVSLSVNDLTIIVKVTAKRGTYDIGAGSKTTTFKNKSTMHKEFMEIYPMFVIESIIKAQKITAKLDLKEKEAEEKLEKLRQDRLAAEQEEKDMMELAYKTERRWCYTNDEKMYKTSLSLASDSVAGAFIAIYYQPKRFRIVGTTPDLELTILDNTDNVQEKISFEDLYNLVRTSVDISNFTPLLVHMRKSTPTYCILCYYTPADARIEVKLSKEAYTKLAKYGFLYLLEESKQYFDMGY